MRKLYLFAAMAAMLASCSSDDLTKESAVAQQNAEEGAVLFDVYTQRTTTRAGEVGCLTTDGFKTGNFVDEGFGVFGYYTNSSTYDQQAIPNFFYNQQVYWNSSTLAFEYTPIKYWPNEFTTANADDADKVTYFAYAPWVSVNPNTGKPDGATKPEDLSDLQKWGINSMTTNSTAGDPLIKYIASFDQAKSVDLCWGVCDETNWQKIQDGTAQTFDLGKPWENVERPANTNQKLKFTFKHATAQLMVNIDAFVDGINNANEIAGGTKVYVRAISFEGLATKGSLNLNNGEAGANKAYWMDFNGVNDLPMGETVTIYDGRKDGKEGTPSGEATNEKSLGLNPNLVQSTLWTPATGDPAPMPGVTNVSQPLFCNGAAPATEPIYVIPTGDPVKVTITYDIETADNQLSTYVSDAEQHGSSIENVIWKNITFGKDELGKVIDKFENGKSYTINLHLGMNSVKFDAAVTDWVPQHANDVDLPANIPSYAATSGTGTDKTAELAYDLDSYQFAITGLEPFEEISPTPTPVDPVTTITQADGSATIKANASGVAYVKLGLNKNTKVTNNTTASAIVFEGGTSHYKVNINVTQKAAPLGLAVNSLPSLNVIKLSSTASGTNWGALSPAPTIEVVKNGVPVNHDITLVNYTNSIIGNVTLPENVALGDVYTFTVKAGDAPAETVTASIGGIAFVPNTATTTYTTTAGAFSKEPQYYGAVPSNYEYTLASSNSVAKVENIGESNITTLKAGTETIQCTATTPSDGDGWFYPAAFKTSTYTLTVNKQAATISFSPSTATASVTAGTAIDASLQAKLYDASNAELTPDNGGDQLVNNDAIVYTVDNANFEIAEVYKVKPKETTAPGTYNVTVTATVTDGKAYSYAKKTDTYKMTVTVLPITTAWSTSGYTLNVGTTANIYKVELTGLTMGDVVTKAITDTSDIIDDINTSVTGTVPSDGKVTVTIKTNNGTSGQSATIVINNTTTSQSMTLTVQIP